MASRGDARQVRTRRAKRFGNGGRGGTVSEPKGGGPHPAGRPSCRSGEVPRRGRREGERARGAGAAGVVESFPAEVPGGQPALAPGCHTQADLGEFLAALVSVRRGQPLRGYAASSAARRCTRCSAGRRRRSRSTAVASSGLATRLTSVSWHCSASCGGTLNAFLHGAMGAITFAPLASTPTGPPVSRPDLARHQRGPRRHQLRQSHRGLP